MYLTKHTGSSDKAQSDIDRSDRACHHKLRYVGDVDKRGQHLSVQKGGYIGTHRGPQHNYRYRTRPELPRLRSNPPHEDRAKEEAKHYIT